MFTKEVKFPIAVKSALAVNNTASSVAVNGNSIYLKVTSGNLWINPITTAVADSTSYLIVAADAPVELSCTNLSMISDGSGAVVKYIINSLQ